MIRLQREREARGLSKAKLSRLADINATYVYWAEGRGFQLGQEHLRKLAAALGLPQEEAPTLIEKVES